MKKGIPLFVLSLLGGCADEPTGRWVATEDVDVYAEVGGYPKVFIIPKGMECALGNKWIDTKGSRFKKVSCPNGNGWIRVQDFEYKGPSESSK